MNTAINNKDYDIALVGWELSSVPDAINIIQSSGYTDEKLTNYITSLLGATTPKQISDIYNSIQKYVNQNVLFMSLVIRDDYIVSNRRLEGDIAPNDFDVMYEKKLTTTFDNKNRKIDTEKLFVYKEGKKS